MTFPVWIGAGPLKVHPHLFFELLAYAAAATVYVRERRRLGDAISAPDRWSLVAAALVGAVIGSRLLAWLEDLSVIQRASFITILGNQTMVGGLVGGWLAVEFQKRRLGIAISTGDLFAVAIAVGTAVGRIGCFLSGLPDGTYGVATSLPWGIDLGDGISRHPTALYESVFMAVVAAWLLRLAPSAPRGTLFLRLMAAYFAFRLAVDAIKPGVSIALGLTAIQWVAVAGLVYSMRRLIGVDYRPSQGAS